MNESISHPKKTEQPLGVLWRRQAEGRLTGDIFRAAVESRRRLLCFLLQLQVVRRRPVLLRAGLAVCILGCPLEQLLLLCCRQWRAGSAAHAACCAGTCCCAGRRRGSAGLRKLVGSWWLVLLLPPSAAAAAAAPRAGECCAAACAAPGAAAGCCAAAGRGAIATSCTFDK